MKRGTAYGIFRTNKPQAALRAELPTVRRLARVPSNLELTLSGVNTLQGDSKLATLAQDAKSQGANYALKATYEGATNPKAARELTSTLNQLYQTPLYKAGETFRGGVAYQARNGNYKVI